MAKDANLVYTPTWALASTCAVFIVASLIAERTIYFIGHLLVKYKQTALQEAFERVKEELMMVGFISIALALGQDTFSSICVPTKWSTVMRLCDNSTNVEQRSTLEIRELEETGVTNTCKAGHSPFMTAGSIHQLHILIFILATVHVGYTVVIVALGMWTVGHWKVWEERANAKEQLSVHGGVRLTRETTFMRAHIVNEWESDTILSYVVAFFRQFHNVVSETDYHTLRNGFIKNHMPGNTVFDFHKYIRRSLQDDFKYAVGISPGLWCYAILWLLLNVDGWASNIILTAIPFILLFAVGTKMQHIITKMAVHFSKQHHLTVGLPNVTPNDKLFWFNRPRFILLCIHFVLFQNALELAFDIWAAISFPPNNCLYQHSSLLIGRIVSGLVVQMLCGIITLPIYALVSQMGSSAKKTIFEEHIQKALRKWQEDARVRVRKAHEQGKGRSRRPSPLSSPFQDRSWRPSPLSSPFQNRSSPASSSPLQGNGGKVEMVLHNVPNLSSQSSVPEVRVSINNSEVQKSMEGNGTFP